jgi:dinuclear metal center YbgI/SA1388 family protein
MAKLKEIVDFLDALLDVAGIPEDSSNNGLQVEGKDKVNKIIFSVDASLELAEKARNLNADMIFVHHGFSWGNGFKRITGIDAKRFTALLKNGISLYAAHLPLDGHPEIGHNAIMAKKMELQNCRMFAKFANTEIGVSGELKKAMGVAKFAKYIDKKLGLKSEVFGRTTGKIKKIGVISGGAGTDGVMAAAAAGLDCLITGEIGHSSWHVINETGISVLAGGHYNTEKPGVIAVMEEVEMMFDVNCQFIDIPTGL